MHAAGITEQQAYRPATGKRGRKKRVVEVVKSVRKFCNENFRSFLNTSYASI